MALIEDISKLAGTVEQFIKDLADAFRKKSWVKILSISCAVSALLPPIIYYFFSGAKLHEIGKDSWILWIWIIVTASFFIAAFLVALLAKEKEITVAPPATSIIKGLLAYTNTEQDAKWFAKLQRGRILQECLQFCMSKNYSFGILSGESGTGKTSLLQAGLLSNLGKEEINSFYIKFSDISPFVSIGQAIYEFIPETADTNESSTDDDLNLLEIFQQKYKENPQPIVLVFDQFEQFFVHNKTKAKRKSFIKRVTELHNPRSSLPITIFISIRNDFMDWLREFQVEMNYSLSLHNYLAIKKFEPEQATKIFKVFAEEMGIGFDEDFVKEVTKFELADKEDGTVSPIDIQILAWMLDGQRDSEFRAFDRKAFDELGGVEGLLERFLNLTLKTLQTNSARQSAIQVMQTLTDGQVRAGAFSQADIKKRLRGIVSDRDVGEAVEWLSRSDVRLLTPIQEKNVTFYEIAHERIIPPLRRYASKEVSDVSITASILDFRVSEWLDSGRSSRFLLSRKELKLITRYWTLFSLDSRKEQKEEFVLKSRKYYRTRFVGSAAILLSVLLGFGIYQIYRVFQNNLGTQTNYAKSHLVESLKSKEKPVSFNYAALLLPFTKDEELVNQFWEQYEGLNSGLKPGILKQAAESYKIFSDQENSSAQLKKIENETDKLSVPVSKIDVSLSLAEAYLKSSKSEDADRVIGKTREISINVDTSEKLALTAGIYVKLSKFDEADKILRKVIDESAKLKLEVQIEVFETIASEYGSFPKNDIALKGLDNVLQSGEKIFIDLPKTKGYLYLALIDSYIKLERTEKADDFITKLQQLKVQKWVEDELYWLKIDAYTKRSKTEEALDLLEKGRQDNIKDWASKAPEKYVELAKIEKSPEGLKKIQDTAIKLVEGKLLITSNLILVLKSIIESYGSISDKGIVEKEFENISQIKDTFGDIKYPVYLALAEEYIKLNKIDKSNGLLAEVRKSETPEHLILLADRYVESGQKQEAGEVLRNAKEIIKKTGKSFTNAKYALSIAKIYKKFDAGEALKNLLQSQENENEFKTEPESTYNSIENSSILVDLATELFKSEEWMRSTTVAQSIGDPSYKDEAFTRIIIMGDDMRNKTKNMDALEPIFEKLHIKILAQPIKRVATISQK